MLRKASLRALALTLLLALGVTFASAKVVYVHKTAPGPAHDGTTWATAFLTVQEGLNAAALDDEVWVAKGIYLEQIKFIRNVSLYGGFGGTETKRSQRDWKANATALEAYQGDVVAIRRELTSSFDRIVVDGFTIRRRTYSSNGLGVMARGTGLKVTLANNTITGSYSSVELGSNCTATLVNNTINLEGVVINGGARATLTGNVIRGVYADGAGAVSMIGNTVIGGVYVSNHTEVNYSEVNLKNNIVAFGPTSGIFVGPRCSLTLSHNNAFGNGGGNYHITSTDTVMSGNITADPMFRNREAGDFRLLRTSPCIDAGDDSAVTLGTTDADGRPRKLGAHVDIGAYESALPTPLTISMGAASHSAPAVYGDIVYAGSDDGKLRAYDVLSGQPLSGFPLDLSAALGQPVTFNSRPALYAGSTGMAIFLTTTQGHVAKVSLDGRLLWSLRPLPGHTRSTPAVTPDGDVLVSLGWEDASPSAMNLAFRLDERTGQPKSLSPYLGTSTPDNPTDRSPAVKDRYVYINGTGHGRGGLVVLNQHNLTVRAEFAPEEEALPPLLSGSSLYLATRSGHLYMVNAVTFTPNASFGRMGTVRLGAEITTPPQIGWDGNLYVGTRQGQVFRVQMATGASSLFYATSPAEAITGLVVERGAGVMAVGTDKGRFIRVPLSDPSRAHAETLSAPVAGGPIYSPADGRFYLTTTDGHLLGRPVL